MTTEELGALDAPTKRQVGVLPFRVHVAVSAKDIDEIVAVRATAYLRHHAPGAVRLKVAEKQDGALDTVLLVARSKVDDAVLGSVRIQTRVMRPLMVESALILPPDVMQGTPIELMRGSVRNGPGGRMVSSALAKASFQLSLFFGFTHMIVTCREPVNLMYRAYQFDELLSGEMIDLPYSPGAKHKVLCLPVKQAVDRWRERNEGLLKFMIHMSHPDIEIDFDLVRRRLEAATGP